MVSALLSAQELGVDNNTTVIDLRRTNFKTVLASKQPVFVKFWASWCGPCRRMAPKYKNVSKLYVGKIVFSALNVDEEKEIANTYRVHSIPTTILFINGKEMDRISGGLGSDQLKYWANEIIRGRYK